MRGNRAQEIDLVNHRRSIPACAGEPPLCDHPPIHAPGLSPRVRGNHLWVVDRWACSGSIPACAGEPTTFGCSGSADRVYPRVCGGTVVCPCPQVGGHGLSPRVRGNLKCLSFGHRRFRSIPACAGEPPRGSGPIFLPRVYPRVCGGTVYACNCAPSAGGLSPRVRGNRRHVRRQAAESGSIPACAGEPHAGLAYRRKQRVYPRVCGGTQTSYT